MIAEKLASAVAEKLNIPLLPTLAYGCSIGHSRRWPGTIALQGHDPNSTVYYKNIRIKPLD